VADPGSVARIEAVRPFPGKVGAAEDGQRFLMMKDNAAGDSSATPANMVVVLNWLEELKARVPTNGK